MIFVAGGLPGDRVRARVGKSKKSWAEASIVELLEPAAERIADRCVHGGEPCPGAAWQGLPYELQLDAQAGAGGRGARAARRVRGRSSVEPIVAAVEQWRYRNKLEYSFGCRREGAGRRPALGFHARGRWDQVVDVDDCLLASEANNAARNAVRDWARTEGIPAHDRESGAGVLRNLIVREGRRTGQIQTRLVTSAAEFPEPPVDLHTVDRGPLGQHRRTDRRARRGVPARAARRPRPAGLAAAPSCRRTPRRPSASTRPLASSPASAPASASSTSTAGSARSASSMAADAGEVWGVESVPEAIVDAEANAELNGIGNAQLPRRRRPARDPAADRGGRQARRRRHRPAPRRALARRSSAACSSARRADRLRLLQPDDDGAERPADGRRRL